MRKIALLLIPLALSATVALNAQAPAGTSPEARPVETSLSGVLAFVDDKPAIKTDSGTLLLMFPDFFKYAYFEGYKAGVAIKAKGLLIAPPAPPQDAALQTASPPSPKFIAKELTISAKTYIIVDGPPRPSPKGHPRPSKDKIAPPIGPIGDLAPPADSQEAYVDTDD